MKRASLRLLASALPAGPFCIVQAITEQSHTIVRKIAYSAMTQTLPTNQLNSISAGQHGALSDFCSPPWPPAKRLGSLY
jgi:hypothetical protein